MEKMKLTETIKGIDLADYPHSFFVWGKCRAKDIKSKEVNQNA